MPIPEIESALFVFRYQKSLADRALVQLADEDLHWQPAPDLNSIAVLVRHMAGNMKSRWTNFLTEDGEKPWRHRDEEFEVSSDASREILMTEWDAGWRALFETLESLQLADLQKSVLIRGKAHSPTEAIHRQLSHYGYHTGQIVLLARLRCGDRWQTLSIGRGGSETYKPQGKY